jgi:hypothetical protein
MIRAFTFAVCVGVGLSAEAQASKETSAATTELVVGNYAAYSRMQISMESGTIRVLERKVRTDEGKDFLGPVFREIRLTQDWRKLASDELPKRGFERGAWALFSPDGARAAVSADNPAFNPVFSVSILDLGTKKVLRRLACEARCTDFAWTSDARGIAVIEVADRSSLAPIDLMKALAGHPVRYNSFGVRQLDVNSGRVRQVAVANEIEQGFAHFATAR